MSEDINTTNMLRSPLLLGMISLLVLLIAGFSLNLYVLSGSSGGGNTHAQHAGEMQGVAQGMATHAIAASSGNLMAFASLARDEDEFDRRLNVLRGGAATGLAAAPAAAGVLIAQVVAL